LRELVFPFYRLVPEGGRVYVNMTNPQPANYPMIALKLIVASAHERIVGQGGIQFVDNSTGYQGAMDIDELASVRGAGIYTGSSVHWEEFEKVSTNSSWATFDASWTLAKIYISFNATQQNNVIAAFGFRHIFPYPFHNDTNPLDYVLDLANTTNERHIREIRTADFPFIRTSVVEAVAVNAYPGHATLDELVVVLTTFHEAAIALNYFHASATYSSSNGTSGNETVTKTLTEADFAFYLRFLALVEYIDTNGIPGLQMNDTIIAYYNLDRFTVWKPLYHQEVNGDGSDIHTYVLETRDAVLRVKFHFSSKTVKYFKTRIDPSSVKFDVIVQNWNYTSPSPNARIGIIAVAVTEGVRAIESTNGATTGGNFTIVSKNNQGRFNWDGVANTTEDIQGVYNSSTVYVDYTDIDGSLNLTAGYTVSRLIFSFDANRPSWIFWDPLSGVTPSDASAGSQMTSSNIENSSTKMFASLMIIVIFIVLIV